MRKLIGFFFSLVALAAIIYVVVMVPMGGKTLWQHIVAVANTDESKQMVKGVKDTAGDVIRKGSEAVEEAADKHTEDDRKKLRKLIKKLEHKEQ